MVKYFHSKDPLVLENGKQLENFSVAYHTYGEYVPGETKVIWACHALTANSDVADWWSNIFGEGKILDDQKYFIVCANVLGSCYGSTSPNSEEFKSAKDFPSLTIRDLVKAHVALRIHLRIENIFLLLGGSIGGQQAMEWAIEEPSLIQNLVLLATNARHSAWGIAFNETQRMALELGDKGLEVARAIAMLSYRNYEMYSRTLRPEDTLGNYGASSYQRYQGKKLAQRFRSDSYRVLTQAMDGHDVGRGRGSIEAALQQITANVLIIGIATDILFPPLEQELLHKTILDAELEIIESSYGHDGFLTEGKLITERVLKFLKERNNL